MAMELDELLQGAWDLHCHCYPELSLEMRMREDDSAMVSRMAANGMAGVMLKSHFWPTTTRAYYLNQQIPGIRVLGSISLNRLVGGLDPLALEAAARLGAKGVFFPTWNSTHDMQEGGFSRRVQQLMPLHGSDEDPGIAVSSEGRLTPAAEMMLDVAKEFDMLVCTGHVYAREAVLLAAGAQRRGLGAVFTHPLHSANDDEMRAAADNGAFIEITCLQILGPSMRPATPLARVAQVIRDIGVERCILSTDAFGPAVPPATEMIRFAVGRLRDQGFSDAELQRLVAGNPRAALHF